MSAETRLETRPESVEFFVRGERIASYLPHAPVPGLACLMAAEGRNVTQSFLADGVSIWLGHPNLECVSFGDPLTEPTQAQGKFRTEDVIARRGSQSVGLEHTCNWYAPDGLHLLTDVRTLRVQPGPASGSILDLNIELRAPEDRAATLYRSTQGLLRIGLASAFRAASGQIRNSMGEYGTDLNDRSAAWVACVGVVQAETIGLGVLDHPQNPAHPPVWHLDSAGVLQTNPCFWQDIVLLPGMSIHYRYRLLAHSGYVEAGWAAARLHEFVAYRY